MRRFILRSLLFAVLVVAVFGGLCALEVGFELKQYYGVEAVAGPQATAVVCSDSQTDMGVDPSVVPEIFNFSAHGRLVDQYELALIDAFAVNPGRFKTVIVDLSPASVLESMDKPLAEMIFSSKYYLLHFLHLKENRRDLSGIGTVFRDNMVGRRFRLLSRALRGVKKFESSIRGGFTPEAASLLRTNPKHYETLLNVKVGQVRGLENLSAESPVFEAVDQIIALAKAHGAQVVLTTTPWRPDVRERCGKARLDHFTEVMRTYAARRQCPYLDFLRREFPDDHWYDCVHLNLKGAGVFSPILRDALREGGLL